MSTKRIKTVSIIIFVYLVISFSTLAYILIMNPGFDIAAYISAISSFFAAILTVLYVQAATKQLEVMTKQSEIMSNQTEIMSKQLTQMEQESKYKSRPLPYFENVELVIEPSRFFYSPPTNEYNFISRYIVKGILKNMTEEPALSLYLTSKIVIKKQTNSIELLSFDCVIDTLGGKEKTKEGQVDLYITMDDNGLLFDAIREMYTKSKITLHIKLLYRSISGGCFKLTNCYYLSIKDEDIQKIKIWHEKISLFNTRYKEQLEELKRIRNKDSKRWHEIFDKIRAEICAEEEENVIIRLRSNSNQLRVDSIDGEEYETERSVDNFRELLALSCKKD